MRPMRLALVCLAFSLAILLASHALAQNKSSDPTEGELRALEPGTGKPVRCPLEHTDVRAEISGFVSRVTVTQRFVNPLDAPVEAVYRFPLPHNAAVDRMTMKIGDRAIDGKIMRKEEARVVYEEAKAAGDAAGLLDQERPNIFTQRVANILPGEPIEVQISYVETLDYEDGYYELVFPMMIGERYVPASVRDASAVQNTETRPGAGVSIEVVLDAGVAIQGIESKLHNIETDYATTSRATVRLANQKRIPNRDFILRYKVAGRQVSDALLAHNGERGGFFTFILQPPARFMPADVAPKEIVFVLDTSGSMEGFPIEKAKEAMRLALDGLYPEDTFNLITFAGDTRILFEQPVPATKQNLDLARRVLAGETGAGGTEMMTAIRAALEPSDSADHLRVVCFMTDGYVGNEMEILAEIQKHPNARVFAFGIGDSINRYLLDKMASEGRGAVEYVTLEDDGSEAARRFHERVRSPLLTDVTIDWRGLPVTDVYPARIPDVFSSKPVVVSGRFDAAAKGVIVLKGKAGGIDFSREIEVKLPKREASHDSLATLWARGRVDELMRDFYLGTFKGEEGSASNEITRLGLEFGLMTQWTSFVAVERRTNTVAAVGPSEKDSGEGDGSGYNMGGGSPRVGGGGGGGNRKPSAPSLAAMPNIAASETVDVTTSDEPIVDISSTRTSTNVTKEEQDLIPKSLAFSSAINVAPGVRSGDLKLDGASGENASLSGVSVAGVQDGQLAPSKAVSVGPSILVSRPSPRGPSTEGLEPSEVARIFYRWYMTTDQPVTCDAFRKRHYLFQPDYLEKLCSSHADGGETFGVPSRPVGFRVRGTETMGDVCTVTVDVRVGGKWRRVIVTLYYEEGWRIGKVSERLAARVHLAKRICST